MRYIIVIILFFKVSCVISQKDYNQLITDLDGHTCIPKKLLKKLIKNQFENIKKSDGIRHSGINEYFLKDSTLIKLNGLDYSNESNCIVRQFVLIIHKKNSLYENIYEFDIHRNKIFSTTQFSKLNIGKSMYYHNNKIMKSIDNDSLFKITPDSIVSIVNKRYSINVYEINHKAFLNRNISNAYNEVEIRRDFVNAPKYRIVYDKNTDDNNNITGFYLEIDGITGEIITQRNISSPKPVCGN